MREFPQHFLLGFRDGEKAAFDALYAAFAPWLFGICLRYTRCESDAQDVLQEAFIKIYQSRKTLDLQKPVAPWLKTITIRSALNFARDQYRFVPQGDEDFIQELPEELEENKDWLQERSALLLKALQNLPDGHRMIFNMYAIDGLTHREIADFLGIAEGTSKSQYAKAKMKLKKIVESAISPV